MHVGDMGVRPVAVSMNGLTDFYLCIETIIQAKAAS